MFRFLNTTPWPIGPSDRWTQEESIRLVKVVQHVFGQEEYREQNKWDEVARNLNEQTEEGQRTGQVWELNG